MNDVRDDDGFEMPVLKGPVEILIEADMPEQISLLFSSTGPKGGDAGHGGDTTLEITSGAGTYQLNDQQLEPYTRISFIGCGDWEMSGMISAIIALADRLKQEIK